MGIRYLKINQAAELLGVSALTLRNWDKNGKLKAKRDATSNYRVYNVSELEKFKKEVGIKDCDKYRVKLVDD